VILKIPMMNDDDACQPDENMNANNEKNHQETEKESISDVGVNEKYEVVIDNTYEHDEHELTYDTPVLRNTQMKIKTEDELRNQQNDDPSDMSKSTVTSESVMSVLDDAGVVSETTLRKRTHVV
jgi:hypothetical protein